MSKHTHSDDLFEGSTMTFGEHLEELRSALFKAIIGVLIGFLGGLLIANRVVKLIESPLRNALGEYYITSDIEELKLQYSEDEVAPLELFMRKNRVTFDTILVETAELARWSKSAGVTDSGDVTTALEAELPLPAEQMLKTRIWRPVRTKITSLSAQEAFMIWLKAAFITGLLVASPYVFWHLWTFVAAGLFPHERKYVYVYLPFSVVLFLAGSGMAFFFVFQPVLDFLFQFNRAMDIDPDPRISEWISFVLFLPIGFGVAFQLPLVMLFISRIGVFSVEQYLAKWRIAILVIFVISMLLTPADPISMLMMAGPLSVLYFLGIAMCQWMPRGRNPFNEAYEP